MINIFGVVLFLRTGWLVGNTGVLLGVVLVSFVILVALVTVLSGIGVCERCSIGSGGVYSMVSTVLGGKVGGTVGLLYIFGQCVAGAMYITGFAESISDLLNLENMWVVRGISLAVLVALLGINLAGVKWIIRLQLLLLLLLAISTLDFVIGSFTHLDPENGFVGYSEELLRTNTFPDYSPGETFFTVFGVFFPAATGVMVGFNMSGDLQRPSRNIPVGFPRCHRHLVVPVRGVRVPARRHLHQGFPALRVYDRGEGLSGRRSLPAGSLHLLVGFLYGGAVRGPQDPSVHCAGEGYPRPFLPGTWERPKQDPSGRHLHNWTPHHGLCLYWPSERAGTNSHH
ncbi:hypothetical protein XENTR_v10024905 [Xenopus tropicalis]|nr:hypothetical protein XENTR_v10024905 [Xenopus tropicalis]